MGLPTAQSTQKTLVFNTLAPDRLRIKIKHPYTNKNYTRELGLWSFRPTIAFTSPRVDGGS